MQLLAALTLGIWLYLLLGRGGFWLSSQRDDATPAGAKKIQANVSVVIPARDEAEGIGACIGSLLRQDYAGDWSIILVDDGSRDRKSVV